MGISIFILLLTWAYRSTAQTPPLQEKAIVPTASGQIGVNPVLIYHAPHAHTEFWDQEPSSAVFKGTNTAELTELPVITTVDNTPTTTSSVPLHIVASTVTSAVEELQTGDVTVALSPELLSDLKSITEKIPCDAAKGKRQIPMCEWTPARIEQLSTNIGKELGDNGILNYLKDTPIPKLFTLAVGAADVEAVKVATLTVVTFATVNIGVTAGVVKFPHGESGVSWANPILVGSPSASQPGCPSSINCKDCGGTFGICVTQSSMCPCVTPQEPEEEEKKKCPEEKLSCEDNKCKGDDRNKCTVDNQGCECTYSCETHAAAKPICDDCGGDAGEKKCKGISDKNNKYKACPCYDRPKSKPPQKVLTEEQWRHALATWKDPSWPTPPENPDPPKDEPPKEEQPKPLEAQCLKRDFPAPQRKSDVSRGDKSVEEGFNEWCDQSNGLKLQDTVYGSWRISDMAVSNRRSFWIRASPVCDGSQEIKKDDCIATLNEGMMTCDPGSGATHGVSVKGKENRCIEYAIDVSSRVDHASPPWNEGASTRWPPPENAELLNTYKENGQEITCRKDKGREQSNQDFDAAVEKHCSDPKPERPLNWVEAGVIGVRSQNIGEPCAYKEGRFCNGQDSSKKDKDDCVYALRRIRAKCGTQIARAGWVYRNRWYEIGDPKKRD